MDQIELVQTRVPITSAGRLRWGDHGLKAAWATRLCLKGKGGGGPSTQEVKTVEVKHCRHKWMSKHKQKIKSY